VFGFSLQLLSETFLILKRNEQNMITNVYWSPSSKVPFILWDFNETWIILTDFRKILKHRISWKSFRWEPSCSMRTDGQRDMAMLTVNFHDYANSLKTCYLFCYLLNNTLVSCERQNEWKMNWKKLGRKQMCGLIESILINRTKNHQSQLDVDKGITVEIY